MKNHKQITILILLFGLLILTAFSTLSSTIAASPASSNFLTSKPQDPNIIFIDSNAVNSYTYNFTIFGMTYTIEAVTNSQIDNFTMSESGLGLKFEANPPSGTTGFCNVTVPANLMAGANVAIFEDNIKLLENVAYTKELVGSDYFFHITFPSGTHTYTIEAAAETPTPTPNQSGISTNTIITIAAVGAVAGVSAAVIIGLKGAILAKIGGASAAGAGGGAGAGGAGASNIPPPTSGGPAGVPTGTNVFVNPHPNVHLTFGQVTQAGGATAIPISAYPPPPGAIPFIGAVFDIKTTAIFTGLVIVGILFDGSKLKEKDKKKLRVYRNDPEKGGAWVDVTSSIDTKKNIAYAATDHFSIFGVR